MNRPYESMPVAEQPNGRSTARRMPRRGYAVLALCVGVLMLVVSTQTDISANLIKPGAADVDTVKAIAVSVAEVHTAMAECESALSSSSVVTGVGAEHPRAAEASSSELFMVEDCRVLPVGHPAAMEDPSETAEAIVAANAQTVAGLNALIAVATAARAAGETPARATGLEFTSTTPYGAPQQ